MIKITFKEINYYPTHVNKTHFQYYWLYVSDNVECLSTEDGVTLKFVILTVQMLA